MTGLGRGWGRTAVGVLGLGALAVLAGGTLVAAGWAVGQPVGLDYAEPVVYGQAMRIVGGEPLYQPIDQAPFTVAAYTPLYYWLAAALQVTVGAGFGPGRALSLAAGVVTALMVGAIAGRQSRPHEVGATEIACASDRQGGVWVGAFAGLVFLGLGFAGPIPWLGLYRVDLVGVALSVAAMATLTHTTSTRAVIVAGGLAGLAMLCKQTLIAALIAGTLWQWRDRPRAGAFLGAALLTFAIPCLVLEITTNGAFVQNTVEANVNPFHPAVAAGLLPIFLETQWLPLLLALVYLVVQRPWHTRDARLLVLYWSASSVWLLGIAKIGANFNYWIEFAAATAILAARGAAWVMTTSRPGVAVAGAIALVLVLGMSLTGPNGVRASLRTVRANVGAPRNVEFDALVDRVRHSPGAVLAEPMDVVVLAGRPVLLEPFIYNLLLETGRWRPDGLVGQICDGEIGLVVLGYPVEVGARMTDGLYALWPAPVMAALQDSMVLDGVEATRYVYTPRSPPAPGCGGAR